MKKSKIIVPALGILLLSTAASISGTVAWFTANRTFNFTAGDFAVVNTKNNLKVTLAAGAGTSIVGDVVQVIDGYKLTDASFDHTVATANVVVPNDTGETVKKNVTIFQAKDALTTALNREGTIYSAFTWDATFTLNVSSSETKRMGLFLDLSDANTYVREKVVVAEADVTAHRVNPDGLKTTVDLSTDATKTGANYYEYKAAGGEAKDDWYTDDACTVAASAALTAGTTYYKKGVAAGTYYKAAPDDTGKALRIAIVPLEMDALCYGVAKVWAENQTKSEPNNCKFVDGLDVDDPLAGTAYDTATISKLGSASIGTDSVGSGKVLMAYDDNTVVPNDDTIASSAAKSSNTNYIGYFAATAGATLNMKFRFVAWYEGTDPNITNDSDTIYETCVVGMQFGTSRFTDGEA